MTPPPRSLRTARLLPALLLPLAATATLLAAPVGGATADVTARPAVARQAEDANPLAGHPWGVEKSVSDPAWAAFEGARGKQRRLLARIAHRPRARWFGAWIRNGDIADKVGRYLQATTGGDADTVAQLTVFRMVPWEQETCRRLPTVKEKRSYRRWVRRFATAVGDRQRAVVVLQPDGPFSDCAPGGSDVPARMIAWTAKVLGGLENTTTYVEIGSAGWNHLDAAAAARLAIRHGVGHVRGFHLNTTHYEGVPREVRFGAEVVEALADLGQPGKHFTVDTAENGRPFTWQQFQDRYGDRHHFNHAPACKRRSQRRCVTLGIPPTTRVAAKKWRLPRGVRTLARHHVDGYLWAGRPWLRMQSSPFQRRRALQLARTTPYR